MGDGLLLAGLDAFRRGYDHATVLHVDLFEETFKDDTKRAQTILQEQYDAATKEALEEESQDSAINATLGDCYRTGRFYPLLTRDQRTRDVSRILERFNRINDGRVSGARGDGITTTIREPSLIRDIAIGGTNYSPTLHEGRYLLKARPSWNDWQDMIGRDGYFVPGRVVSDFVVAYSLLRSDLCDFSEEFFAAMNPSFRDRTLQAIVGMRLGAPVPPDTDLAMKVDSRMQRLFELLPGSVHGRIKEHREQADWVDYRSLGQRPLDWVQPVPGSTPQP